MRRLAQVAVAIAMSLAFCRLAEALGWDAKDQKLFFSIHRMDQSGRPPAVIYFALGGPQPERPVQVSWSKDVHPNDSLFTINLERLRKRLRPLEEIIAHQTVFRGSRVVAVDSVFVYGGWTRRYRVEVRGIGPGRFEVLTLVEPSVRMIRAYRLPELKIFVGILSFRGVPTEEMYETQVPVLVLPRPEWERMAPLRRIEWIRWE